MLAQRDLLFVRETEPPGLLPLLVCETGVAGMHQRDRVQESELGLLRGPGQQRLDLDARARPVLEIDEGRD